MICKNCGKIIPDDVCFCGYCGVKTEAEETDNVKEETEEVIPEEAVPEETVPEESVQEEAPAETPSEEETIEVPAEPETPAEEAVIPREETVSETSVEEVKEEKAEEPVEETSESPEEAIVDETPEEIASEEETAEENSIDESAESSDEIMDAEITDEVVSEEPKQPGRAAVFAQNLIVKIRENVHKEDYMPLLESLKHPREHTEYTVQSVCTVFGVTLILNWIAFHGFFKGLITELIMIFGALVVQFADDSRNFSVVEAIRRTAEMLEIPAILIFAACLFSMASGVHMQYMIFVVLAAVRYVIGCGELAERSRYGYLHMLFVAAALISAGIVTGLI